MKLIAVALGAALMMGTVAHAQQDEAAPYVQAFCGLRAVEGGNARIHLMSPSLVELVNKALAVNAKLQAETPDEKPPLGDGVPYQSYPDVAPKCEPGAAAKDGDAIVAEVKYSFPDSPDANWTDRLVLVADDAGTLLVDDILYGETGEDGTLRAFLDDIVAGQ